MPVLLILLGLHDFLYDVFFALAACCHAFARLLHSWCSAWSQLDVAVEPGKVCNDNALFPFLVMLAMFSNFSAICP